MGKLAIMDYGVGGLDLYSRIKQSHPNLGIMYFSDSGETPYGKLSKASLYKRVRNVVSFLKQNGADTVVVACHSASSVACLLNDDKVIDLIAYSLESVEQVEDIKNVGIVGGGRTIRSGNYRKSLTENGFKVSQRIAQPLSIFVERAEIDSVAVCNAIKTILKPIRNVDALLLACTHYPVLRGLISGFMGEQCTLIDPIVHLYEKLYSSLSQYEQGDDVFYTSGDALLMRTVSKLVYTLDLKPIIKLNIDFSVKNIY